MAQDFYFFFYVDLPSRDFYVDLPAKNEDEDGLPLPGVDLGHQTVVAAFWYV